MMSSPRESTADRCSSSEESFDVYDGESDHLGDSDWSSTASRGSSNVSNTEMLPLRHPASEEGLPDQRKGETEEKKSRGMEEEEEVEEEGNEKNMAGETLVRKKPVEENKSSKASERVRRKRRDRKKRKEARSQKGGTGLDDAWSNRWLTVLLTELGIHQSQQRTVLSEHMPEKFRDDGKTREVAPAYEYSDVVEEVVKLHPPVGWLLLEEIERGNIVTRSDALAHLESLERSAVPNQAKLLVDEFLAEDEVRNLIAAAETLELDLAQCAASGTLFNDDDIL
eukprot:g7833.t1